MKNSRDNFGKAWRDVFEGSSVTPREEVWTKIDSRLSQQQVGKYRRKLLIYKLMAAASVIFAAGLGLYSILESDNIQPGRSQIVTQDIPEMIPGKTQEISGGTKENLAYSQQVTGADGAENSLMEKELENGKKPAYGDLVKNEAEENVVIDRVNDNEDVGQARLAYLGEINFLSGQGISSYEPEDDIKAPEKQTSIFDEPWIEFYEPEEEQDDEQVLWAGIKLSSGAFDPNISYGSRTGGIFSPLASADESADFAGSAPSANFDQTGISRASYPERSEYQPEFSYAYGLNMGYQISDRLIIMSGLSYMYNNSSTSTNSYMENTKTNKKITYQLLNVDQIERAGLNSYNSSNQPIELNNTYEFLSVPVNLGYSIIDKKIECILLGGISANFLLQNQIYDDNGYLSTIELSSGNSSPYNLTYLNGNLGTQINYSVSGNYLISLEPSYSLGLSYLTKEEAVFNSRPNSWFISAGLSYIFK